MASLIWEIQSRHRYHARPLPVSKAETLRRVGDGMPIIILVLCNKSPITFGPLEGG
ncbi:hypothetical protein BX600DRAFT_452380 [Xylariales sp. PMI_506]|nr:hypothetical protein BX600DRAFT_452380 [Xylariales sp. PMI_506]